MIEESVTWEEFKKFRADRNAHVTKFVKNGTTRFIASDGPLAVFYSTADKALINEFDTLYGSNVNQRIDKRSSITGVQEVSFNKGESPSTTRVSHDWCNKTTWYQGSVKATGETLVTSDSLTFSSDEVNWINLESGLLYDEDRISAAYRVSVYIDGVKQESGFTLDHKAGSVTFESEVTGVVTADFHHAQSSLWTLEPDAGKMLILEHAELNFEVGALVKSPMNFEIWAYNPYFNSEEPISETNPLKIRVNSIRYKNERDLVNAGNRGQGFIPKVGNLPDNILVFPFDYSTVKPLNSNLGVELRLYTDNDIEYGGDYATASFYVISKDAN